MSLVDTESKTEYYIQFLRAPAAVVRRLIAGPYFIKNKEQKDKVVNDPDTYCVGSYEECMQKAFEFYKE